MPSAARAKIATSRIISGGAAKADRHGGFTLLELLIVLAIMAVLSGVALSFGSGALGRDKPELAARDIAEGLRRARARAISENIERVLELDVEARQMRVAGEAVRPLPPRLDLGLMTATTERRSSTVGGIRFFPDGSSTGGEITVGDTKQAFTVRVEWLTGGIEVVRASPLDPGRR